MNQPYPERLYYLDPYLTEFEAQIVERLTWEDHPAVILDRTAFYPLSGGQPSDRGTLSSIPVVDVQVRASDGAIIHALERPLPEDSVTGQVDWVHRFDCMQQHTGQHLLSAACEKLLTAGTVAFHLGTQVCTIDLNVERIPLQAMEPVEERINQVIWQNRPVKAYFVDRSALAQYPMRRPPKVDGPVRLVEVCAGVEDHPFDINPCGGTHLSHTGEIGLLKILRLDYRGKETRVEFLCGQRALQDYQLKNQTALRLATTLTVGHWELEKAVDRLQTELKETQRELKTAREQALKREAAQLVENATPSGALRVIQGVWQGRDPSNLRALARMMITTPGVVVLLASLEERTQLCVACSDDAEVDSAAILRSVCESLGGKGGGQPGLAQGSAPLVDRTRVEEVLTQIAATL